MLKNILEGQSLIHCPPDAKITDVAKVMKDKNVGATLVLSNGKPRGILTDRDIVVRCIAENLDTDDCTVEQVMTESLETVSVNDGIFDCIQKMDAAHVRRIPVVDEKGNAVGILSYGDLSRILAKELATLNRQTTPDKKDSKKLAA